MNKLIIYIAFLNIFTAYSQYAYKARNESFNTKSFDEISPVLYNDSIVFCSNITPNGVIKLSYERKKLPLNIYIAAKDDDNPKPHLFSDKITTMYNEGPVCFSPDGLKMYFTRNNIIGGIYGKGNKSKNKFGIYIAEKTADGWGNITKFEHSEEKYNYGYPALSSDGMALYFSSDKPGGSGGFDIYVSNFIDGAWSIPENIGRKINTSSDELYPYYHPSDILFYSTNRYSRDAFDIYMSKNINGVWQSPSDIGSPFNSSKSNFGFIIDKDMNKGYFCSSRSESSDIYSFSSPFAYIDSCTLISDKSGQCFIFYEPGSFDLDTTSFRYEWDMGDETKIRSIEAEHCYENSGKYVIQLNVIDTLTGDIYMNVARYEMKIEEQKGPFFFVEDTIYAGEKITLDASQSNYMKKEVKQYVWKIPGELAFAGEKHTYTFQYPGQYEISLLISTSNSKKEICSYRNITVINKKESGKKELYGR